MLVLFFLYLLVIPFHVTSLVSNTSNDDLTTSSEAYRAKVRREFDWRAYLEIYQDLAKHFSTREEALFHFLKFGRKEGRRFPKIFPNQPSLGIAHRKLTRFLQHLDQLNVPIEDRSFIIYYIDTVDHRESLEVASNNLRIFNSSIVHDYHVTAEGEKVRTNFYWFSIVGGIDNVLRPYIPLDQENVAEADWTLSPGDMFNHFRTLGLFKHTLETKFGSILFTNSFVRGPLVHRRNGDWIKQIRSLLFSNNVGLIGPTISCEFAPHVQTYAFMIRNSMIPIILSEYTIFRKFDDAQALQRRYEVGLSEVILKSGYNISSLLTVKRGATTTASAETVFDGHCLTKPSSAKTADPTMWCDVRPADVMFVPWGGSFLRDPDFCDEKKKIMTETLQTIHHEEQGDLPLILSETLIGGGLQHLFKDYEREMQRDALALSNRPTIKVEELSHRVCFLVRTAAMHEIQPNRTLVETVEEEGIDGIIKSLLRQSDPNWGAFFFITDDKPFEKRLNEILGKFSDPRIEYVDVPMIFRPKYSPIDAGYTPTDYVLKYLLKKEDCMWLSATNADNIYGSDIVRSVRQTLLNPPPDQKQLPDMILTPLDSRNFPEQDYRMRDDKTAWDKSCVGMVATFDLHELGYTVQPRPFVAKVDLAAVFFSRPRLDAERIFFGSHLTSPDVIPSHLIVMLGNFTDPERFPCKGCQDGYFTEYLSRTRLWSYRRLPIDGMPSIMFHGPSPTWCLAAGNVWFDHPDVGSVRCYSRRTVERIRSLDIQPNSIFDWKYFDEHNHICLRFSNLGFLKNAAGAMKT